jgi:hypothetical protein
VAQAATITDFKMTGTPTTKGKATTYNGTATISLKHGPIKGVPISIKLIGTSVMNVWIEPAKAEAHFWEWCQYMEYSLG